MRRESKRAIEDEEKTKNSVLKPISAIYLPYFLLFALVSIGIGSIGRETEEIAKFLCAAVCLSSICRNRDTKLKRICVFFSLLLNSSPPSRDSPVCAQHFLVCTSEIGVSANKRQWTKKVTTATTVNVKSERNEATHFWFYFFFHFKFLLFSPPSSCNSLRFSGLKQFCLFRHFFLNVRLRSDTHTPNLAC